MHKHRAAFTLVELLVVIVIIAVLAGIALPVFSGIQENSRTTKCASNLRQIGAALLAFGGDNNGVLPLSDASIKYYPPASRPPGKLGWTEQLEPYLGTDRKIFTCPSSKLVCPNNDPYGYFMGCRAAYVANSQMTPKPDVLYGAIRLSLLSAPSRYILGGDIASGFQAGDEDSDKDDFTSNPGPPFSATPIPFHKGKSNVLFADGHVAAYAAFDSHAMNTCYPLKPDGTGYNYSETPPLQ